VSTPAPAARPAASGRSFAFLVNPASGGGAAPGAVVPVARLLREAGATVAVSYSPGPRATEQLVAAAVGRGDVVVSVGGDGMLSSLVGPVSRAGGVLGILPAGRGNDFARSLGLPTGPEAHARLLLTGATRAVDLIELDGRTVAGSVYAGVDARASELVDRARRLPGPVQYPWAAIRALAGHRPARYRVEVDGVVHEHDAATVVVANSGCYGQGMRIAPGAELDDGLLDVVVVGAASRAALVRALPSVYDGRHVDRPDVHVHRGRRVALSGAVTGSGGSVPVGGDGEPLGSLPVPGSDPVVARVLPAALTVVAPDPTGVSGSATPARRRRPAPPAAGPDRP
jgi:diacylglycerol kinase (ATP)